MGAGTSYKNKKYSELTKDGRKHALNISNAVLKRGTKVTCLKMLIKVKDEIWLEITFRIYVQNMEIKSMSNKL